MAKRYSANEVSKKITEMMITTGGIGGAVFFIIADNKLLFSIFYLYFLLFTFITYIFLLTNTKYSGWVLIISVFSSIAFSLVLTVPIHKFSTDISWISLENYLMPVLMGLVFSIFQTDGTRQKSKLYNRK